MYIGVSCKPSQRFIYILMMAKVARTPPCVADMVLHQFSKLSTLVCIIQQNETPKGHI